MSIYASREFWVATTERAIRTAAQTAGALLVAAGTGLLDTDWTTAGSVAGMAAVLSVLTSIASAQVGAPGPGLTGAESLSVRPADTNNGED